MKWLWGCEFITDYTFVKMHTIHVFLPLVFVLLIICHMLALHYFISSDSFWDRFTFYSERVFLGWYYLVRDFIVTILIINLMMYFVFIKWYVVFHEESFLPVNTLKTADKILPEWFFLVFFGFVKSYPDKLIGIFFCVILFIILYIFNIYNFYLLLYLKISSYWHFIIIIFILILALIGKLATFVLLCFPIWLHLQLLVFMIYLLFIYRLE